MHRSWRERGGDRGERHEAGSSGGVRGLVCAEFFVGDSTGRAWFWLSCVFFEAFLDRFEASGECVEPTVEVEDLSPCLFGCPVGVGERFFEACEPRRIWVIGHGVLRWCRPRVAWSG